MMKQFSLILLTLSVALACDQQCEIGFDYPVYSCDSLFENLYNAVISLSYHDIDSYNTHKFTLNGRHTSQTEQTYTYEFNIITTANNNCYLRAKAQTLGDCAVDGDSLGVIYDIVEAVNAQCDCVYDSETTLSGCPLMHQPQLTQTSSRLRGSAVVGHFVLTVGMILFWEALFGCIQIIFS